MTYTNTKWGAAPARASAALQRGSGWHLRGLKGAGILGQQGAGVGVLAPSACLPASPLAPLCMPTKANEGTAVCEPAREPPPRAELAASSDFPGSRPVRTKCCLNTSIHGILCSSWNRLRQSPFLPNFPKALLNFSTHWSLTGFHTRLMLSWAKSPTGCVRPCQALCRPLNIPK